MSLVGNTRSVPVEETRLRFYVQIKHRFRGRTAVDTGVPIRPLAGDLSTRKLKQVSYCEWEAYLHVAVHDPAQAICDAGRVLRDPGGVAMSTQ